MVGEVHGAWGKARQVAVGIAPSADALVLSVSCGSAGNCVAGGRAGEQGFVVAEAHGVWGKARVVARGLSGVAGVEVRSVSCGSAGNCVAGGAYGTSDIGGSAFLVSERNGRWGKAVQVPGIAVLNVGVAEDAGVNSVSCPSAGNCAAGGLFAGKFGVEAFLVIEKNGRWGRAFRVGGNLGGGDTEVNSVSCGAAGDCAAGGDYQPGSGVQAFVVNESNGHRGNAIEVPGSGTLNAGGQAEVRSVSCGSARSCAAGGDYQDGSGNPQGFLVSESNGRWDTAIDVPGLGAFHGKQPDVRSVSCASAGNCVAGGSYLGAVSPSVFIIRAFVVSEKNGHWGQAIEVPGLEALVPNGGFWTNAVSCASDGNCGAGGSAFVVSETNGHWRTARLVSAP